MKDAIIKEIKEQYQGILLREENGWSKDKLRAYNSGVSNTLTNLMNTLYNDGTISSDEYVAIDDVFCSTLDTLDF